MGRSIVRLKDIADKTGFSTNTVSLALRESPRIPPETRDFIRAAALELNYLPNQIAKSLVSRQTMTIGLVLTDILNPTLTKTAQALELALSEQGYSTLFATSNNNLDEEIEVVNMFRSRQVDGMLVYPTHHRQIDHIRTLRDANYPVVLLVADPDAGVDAVSVDDRRGAYKATRHLLERGHRRIGFLDAASALGNKEKREGYMMALREFSAEYDPQLVVDPAGRGATPGHDATRRLLGLPNPPTAIFASNDSLALGVLKYCHSAGFSVPSDIAIIGYDNIEFAEMATTPLSSVNYAAGELSQLAVDRLLTLIRADRLPEPEVTLIDPELVIRQSTASPD
jgi:LacI family transcriptional regulator, galactose operon repressor